MMRYWRSVCATALLLAGGCASAPRGAPATTPGSTPPVAATSTPDRSVLDGVFTTRQASSGERTFQQVCEACHRPSEFSGGRFRNRWVGQTAGEIFDVVSITMPESDPGSLSPEVYAALVAYLLRLNGYPAGEEPLAADAATLGTVQIVAAPASQQEGT
jgi:mono/diheme cytochrome c family protein